MIEEIVFDSKHLAFYLVDRLPKTNVWEVRSKSSDDLLGRVKWNPTWRQYCFFPEPHCVWSSDCLESLAKFLREENLKHKRRL